MKRFQLAQRVRVLADADCLAPPPASDAQRLLAGKTGTVVRLRRADEAAWVKMDCDLPDQLRSFPADDACGRANHIILWPSECAAERKTPNVEAKRTAVVGQVERPVRPAADARCCWNCTHWHVREYIHCQCSGPWGGDIQGDPRCTFTPATRSQMLTRHGYTRRPTWRILPSDE